MSVKRRTRRTDAKIIRNKKGVVISCPFCEIPHPIGTTPSACGTKLEVRAVQDVYTGVVCSLCGKPGGQFVKIGHLYRHTNDCSPGKTLFTKPPKMSLSAKLVHKLPDRVAILLNKKFGVRTIEVINPTTKKVLGYTWSK